MTALLDRLDLDPSRRAAVERWLTEDRFARDRPALEVLVQSAADGDAQARAELLDAFDGPLPIGTGGRRGACGPGTNRMNVAVLRETAEGLASAMKAEGVPLEAAVVFDTRRDSAEFAREVSDQLAACGVNVLLVNAARPTPLLSHIVRARGCGAGVVISASHNPPGDNGIKIYGPDGAQVLGRRDKALMEAIKAAMAAPLTTTDNPAGTVTVLEADAVAEVDGPYLDYVRAQATCGDLADASLRVVYSPLHGVGESSVVPVLEGQGVAVHVVDAQKPDGGEFGTVESANPESPAALDLGRALADEVDADLVIANDPDADRVGALAKDGGAWTFIDGNRLAVIMLDHVLRHVTPTERSWVLTTLCTSPLIGALARERGVEAVDDLLVGFKHHAGMMEEQPQRHLEFATEEAHGYLRGGDVHDKDGAVASVMLSEAAAVAKRQGRTVFDQLRDVWARLGYHKETTANLYALGAVGREAIATLVQTWRDDPPTRFGDLSVTAVVDRKDARDTGSVTRDLPGNVLVFELQAEGAAACRLVVRPSGTEPKAKLYALARSTEPTSAERLEAVQAEIDGIVANVLADARARAEAIMKPVLEGRAQG
jgi:phosphomannomutase